MSGFIYQKGPDKIVSITMDCTGMDNSTTDVFIKEYNDAVEQLEKERENIAGVILTSAKKTLFAGGDLQGLVNLKKDDTPYTFNNLEANKAHMRRLECLGKPVVAAINGAALGCGLEIYLACHHRITVNDPKYLFGFPEVSMGLLPGAGGVVRTIRQIGFEKGLPFLLDGLCVNPKKALAAGLVDELAVDREDMTAKAKAWIQANPETSQPWDRKGYEIPGGGAMHPNVKPMLSMMPGILKKRASSSLPVQEVILAAAAESLRVDFDTALRIESRKFVGLATTPKVKKTTMHKKLD